MFKFFIEKKSFHDLDFMQTSQQFTIMSGLKELCDAYSLKHREYYFDRSPRNFDAILGLYRTNKLHLSQGVSALADDIEKKLKLVSKLIWSVKFCQVIIWFRLCILGNFLVLVQPLWEVIHTHGIGHAQN